MKTFRQYVNEDWSRAVAMGSLAMAAGAGTAAVVGFPVAAGVALAGAHYALSRDGLRKDLGSRTRKRRKALSEKKNDEEGWKDSSFKKVMKKKDSRHDARKAFIERWKSIQQRNSLDKETATY